MAGACLLYFQDLAAMGMVPMRGASTLWPKLNSTGHCQSLELPSLTCARSTPSAGAAGPPETATWLTRGEGAFRATRTRWAPCGRESLCVQMGRPCGQDQPPGKQPGRSDPKLFTCNILDEFSRGSRSPPSTETHRRRPLIAPTFKSLAPTFKTLAVAFATTHTL